MKPEPALEVAELTARMVKGDEMAYRIFYDDYFERLRRYLLVVTCGNEETTREALQSALIRVVKHVRRFSSEPELWGWLTVLARTALFDQTRKRKRYWAFLDRLTRHSHIHQTGETELDSDARLWPLLDQNLASLPPDEKELLQSKYFEGISVRQIAENLQTTEKAVESRLVRIRRKLKAALLKNLKHESLLR